MTQISAVVCVVMSSGNSGSPARSAFHHTHPVSASPGRFMTFPKMAEHVLHTNFPNVPMIVNLSRKLEDVSHKLTEEEYRELNVAFVIAAKHIARLENDNMEKEVVQSSLPNTGAKSSFGSTGHSLLASSGYRDTQETSVIADHIHRLEQEVISLNKQLQFVKDHAHEKEKQYHENTQSLVRQVQNMTNLYEQMRREHDASYELLHDKEREQALTLVHLSKAQEEIKRLLMERGKVEKSKQQREHELNDLLQKHSKYSSTQFVALSAQLDAMRVELHKERTQRSNEKYNNNQETAILKDKIQALESIIVAQNMKLQHLTHIDLHTNTATEQEKPKKSIASSSSKKIVETSSKKQVAKLSREEDGSDLSLQSDPRSLTPSPNRKLKSLPSQQKKKLTPTAASRSKSAPRLTSSATRDLIGSGGSTSSSRAGTPVRSIRNKAFQKSLLELQDQLISDNGSLSPSLRSNRQKMMNKLNDHIDQTIEESIVLQHSSAVPTDGTKEGNQSPYQSPSKRVLRDGEDAMSKSEFDNTALVGELSSILPGQGTESPMKVSTGGLLYGQSTNGMMSPLSTGNTALVSSPMQIITSTPGKDMDQTSQVHLQFVQSLPTTFAEKVKSPGPPASATTIYDSDTNIPKPSRSLPGSPRASTPSSTKQSPQKMQQEPFLQPEGTADENDDFHNKLFVECLTVDGKSYIQTCSALSSSDYLEQRQDIPSTLATLLQLHNQTVADYNTLLYTFKQNQQQNHYVKTMYKDDIHDSISVERSLQNQLHTVGTENEYLHDKLLELEDERQRLVHQIEDLEDVAEHHRQQSTLLDANDARQLSPARQREAESRPVVRLDIAWNELKQEAEEIEISELIDELQSQIHHMYDKAHQNDAEQVDIQTSLDFLQALVNYLEKCRQHYDTALQKADHNVASHEKHLDKELERQQEMLNQKEAIIENMQKHIDSLQKASVRAEESIALLKQEGEQLRQTATKREQEIASELEGKKQINTMQQQLQTTLDALEEMKRMQQETASTNQQLLLRQEAILEESKASPTRGRSRTSSSSGVGKHQDNSLLNFKDQVEEMKQALHQDPLFSKFYSATADQDIPDSVLDESDTDSSQAHNNQKVKERKDDWRDVTIRSGEEEQQKVDRIYVVELEERLRHAETRVVLLNETIQNVPVSLTVAQAEKRVLEGKLEKALIAYETNIQRIQQHAVQRVQEVNTFLELEKRDKESLRGKLKEQNETIHQLTHHLKLLNTNQHLNSSNMMSNNMGLYSNGSVGFAGVPINASGNTRTPIQSTVISTPHSVSISHAPPPSIDVHTIPLAPWDETALPIVQTLRNAPSASMSASAHLRASYPAGSIGNVVQTSTPSTTNSTKRRGPSSHSSHIQ